MELELFPAADTLVNEALRRDPENRDALSLSAEIRNRSGSFLREALALTIGILIAAGIAATLLFRYRESWRKLLRPLSLEQELARPMPSDHPHARAQAQPRPHGAGQGTRREAPRGPPPTPRPSADARGAKFRLDQAAKLDEAKNEMRKAEELLRLCRQRDRYQEHGAWFLELEAELNTLTRRLLDPGADAERILPRLRKIMADLREVKFSAGPTPADAAANGEERDYYQILGVSTGASEADIKAAYHKLVKQYHPDRHSGSEFAWIKEESERMTRKLGEAYQVLSDTGRREQYDRELARRKRAGA
jgi:DnaJ-domain-containing protein 1